MDLFKKTKKSGKTQGGPTEEEVVAISSVIASLLASTPKTNWGAIKRTPPTSWKVLGMKDLMAYGKKRKGVGGD